MDKNLLFIYDTITHMVTSCIAENDGYLLHPRNMEWTELPVNHSPNFRLDSCFCN